MTRYAYTARMTEMGRAVQWVKVLQQTEKFPGSNLTGCSPELRDQTLF